MKNGTNGTGPRRKASIDLFHDTQQAAWVKAGYDMIGHRYCLAVAPHRRFTVEGKTESGRLEILESGYMTRYADPAMLAQCLAYGVITEVPS